MPDHEGKSRRPPKRRPASTPRLPVDKRLVWASTAEGSRAPTSMTVARTCSRRRAVGKDVRGEQRPRIESLSPRGTRKPKPARLVHPPPKTEMHDGDPDRWDRRKLHGERFVEVVKQAAPRHPRRAAEDDRGRFDGSGPSTASGSLRRPFVNAGTRASSRTREPSEGGSAPGSSRSPSGNDAQPPARAAPPRIRDHPADEAAVLALGAPQLDARIAATGGRRSARCR